MQKITADMLVTSYPNFEDGFIRSLESKEILFYRFQNSERPVGILPHWCIMLRRNDSYTPINQWQYDSRKTAWEAFLAWDGTGEPAGWTRQVFPHEIINRPQGDDACVYSVERS